MRLTALLIVCLAVVACGDRRERDGPPQPAVEAHSIVAFPPGSAQVGAISVAPVEPRRDMTLRFNGRLIWNEDRTVRLFSPLAGRVISIATRVGDRVKAGQPLALLASPELGQAQSDARKAEQDLGLAQKSFARVQELHAAGVAPTKDLNAAQADLERAKAEYARTRARLKLYGTADTVNQQFALRSPINGVVVERNLNQGQEARPDAPPDKPFFVITDPTRLWFLLDVNEASVGYVKPGVTVQITASPLGDDRIAGTVTNVADIVDPQTRTVKVRGAVENLEQRLKAEMFIVAELRVPTLGGMLVPTRAIYLRGEQHYAFVEVGNGRFARRAVRIGPTYDGYQVVLEGVSATDKVVVEGNLLLEKILAAKD
jgi:cobalt-zinc-cadmium efflux system membrane fusion protein